MLKNSFHKVFRLLSSEDFSNLRIDSKRLRKKNITLYYKKNSEIDQRTRIGLSVSKKVGKANIRNKLRRIFRELFRVSEFKNLGVDVLIVVSPLLFKNSKLKCETGLVDGLKDAINNLFKEIAKREVQ